MYAAREGVPARQSLQLLSGHVLGRGVTANVVLLGLTSFFTDISSEMVSSTLPVYAILVLGLNPLQFGVLDGLYQGASAILRMVGGLVADRSQRHKDIATAGYALSAAAKIGLLASGASLGPLAAAVLVDRAGKGIRTAPRDALISLSTKPEHLGSAFGVHRALDTLGAFAGPVVALAILTAAPRAFDAVFLTSFSFAVVGVGVIGAFVRDRPSAAPDRSRARSTAREALSERGFLALVAVAGMLALFTVSDGFLYLVLQHRLAFSVGTFPALFVFTAFVYFVLAVPLGRVADAVGRLPVFLLGYALLPVVYGLVVLPSLTIASAVVALVLIGAYYAATDGVLAALASSLLPPAVRASGLAALGTVVAVARIAASVVFGAIWSLAGPDVGLLWFGTLSIGAILAGALVLRRLEWSSAR